MKSNYIKGINYEKIGEYSEAYTFFCKESSDLSLSKRVIYNYLGLGTDKNYKESLECLKRIQSSGEKKYLVISILLKEDKTGNSKYINSLKNIKGNANAYELLGMLYSKGKYVNKNYKKSKYYYELAISQGSLTSIEKLSDLYLKKETTFFSDKEAIKLLEENKSKNLVSIYFNLGKIYSNPNYSVYNRKLAIENYKKAYDLGMESAKKRYEKIERY